ncbi:MAG: UDP-N-acetylglucosamine 1-carboxyvinyltransferase, partial [Planctomycetota bacterium]|nr:UDP-N-acetylglucosamine 1-carboxyvinyltransferase [Planctomycetota bacterium]
MDALVITGGRRLKGRVRAGGAKNAALPIMAAAILADGPVRLKNVPNLADIRTMARLLRELGVRVEREDRGGDMILANENPRKRLAPYSIMRTMRAGFCVLGPLMARRGKAEVSLPGGCAIGDRPVDLHLKGLRSLGARLDVRH